MRRFEFGLLFFMLGNSFYLLVMLHSYTVKILPSSTHQETRTKLAIVVPFCDKDADKVMQKFSTMQIECPSKLPIDLILYYDRHDYKLPDKIVQHSCFRQIRLVEANLTENDNVYPLAPSLMFYNIFLDETLKSHFLSYTHMFIFEHDVSLLDTLSFHRLYTKIESHPQKFWVLGSGYLGSDFTATVHSSSNWRWIGHINGNAVYRLNDEQFNHYIKYVRTTYHPELSYDTALWAGFNDYPYNWQINQLVSHRFLKDDFILNSGKDKIQNKRTTLFLHNTITSASSEHLSTKKVSFMSQLVSPLCVFIKSLPHQQNQTRESVASIRRYIPNAIVIGVLLAYQDNIFDKKIVVGDNRVFKSSELQVLDLCPLDRVIFLEPDTIILDYILNKDLFSITGEILIDTSNDKVDTKQIIVVDKKTIQALEGSPQVSLSDIYKLQSNSLTTTRVQNLGVMPDQFDIKQIQINRPFKMCKNPFSKYWNPQNLFEYCVRGTARPKLNGTYELYVPHKSGSTAQVALIQQIRNLVGYNNVLLCVTASCDNRDGYSLIGPVRDFQYEDILTPSNTIKRIVVLRDPRDIIISEYYSYGYTHVPPNEPIAQKAFQSQRQAIQSGGIDWYINYRWPQIKNNSLHARESESLTVIPYKLLVVEPQRFVQVMLDTIGLGLFFEVVWKGCRNIIDNQANQIHKTHIRNPIGGYWKNLTEEQQLLLNNTFQIEVNYLERLESKFGLA